MTAHEEQEQETKLATCRMAFWPGGPRRLSSNSKREASSIDFVTTIPREARFAQLPSLLKG